MELLTLISLVSIHRARDEVGPTEDRSRHVRKNDICCLKRNSVSLDRTAGLSLRLQAPRWIAQSTRSTNPTCWNLLSECAPSIPRKHSTCSIQTANTQNF